MHSITKFCIEHHSEIRPQILSRPKQGFSSALPYLLQREYAQLYTTCLRDSRLAHDGILDGAAMTRLIDEHLAKRADHGNRRWLLINAEVWYRMKILGQSKEDMRAELTSSSGYSLRPAAYSRSA